MYRRNVQYIESTIIRKLEKLGKVSKIVTRDEKWIPYKDIVRKRQWLDKDEPPLPDPKANMQGKKKSYCVWWDCRGIIYHELSKPDLTITEDRCVQQLQKVQEKLRETRPTLVNR
ncbi:HTH_48 domain-containing protein [Trichonephila clavipes]|nr:HTH_48 domain-containing protein [Trichonephila clavipes]